MAAGDEQGGANDASHPRDHDHDDHDHHHHHHHHGDDDEEGASTGGLPMMIAVGLFVIGLFVLGIIPNCR
ncbi:MAG: hypothetical protein AB1Z98_31735 [Nannocystaceae bacterium]